MSSGNSALSQFSSIHYPDSDGKPMAENTEQLRWIVVLYGNLAAMYRDRPDVFVAADNLWYPVEGHPEIATAPDVYVVFGRPKGDRASYKQWEEDEIPLSVVIEVLSPGNDLQEMLDKEAFYDEYGVEEYYLHDPARNRLRVYVRKGEMLVMQRFKKEWVSPRLKIRFDMTGQELKVFHPDGKPFRSFEELHDTVESTVQRAEHAEQRAEQAEQRLIGMQRALELSRKARLQQATAEELQELERLEQETAG